MRKFQQKERETGRFKFKLNCCEFYELKSEFALRENSLFSCSFHNADRNDCTQFSFPLFSRTRHSRSPPRETGVKFMEIGSLARVKK